MTESPPLLHSPATDPRERIASIDVLRGVAVLGILAVNIWFFAFPFDVANNPTLWGEYVGADRYAWLASWIGIEGSQRAIFTMLFGASVLLFTNRLASDERRSVLTKIYCRRTGLLIIFGLINGYILLWSGDILFFYGVVGLLLFLVKDWRPRTLLVVGTLVVVLLGLFKFGVSLAEDGMSLEPSSLEKLREEIETRRAGYVSAFLPNAVVTTTSYIVFGLFALFWESLAYMMIGMALFKLKVFDASRSTLLYLGFMLLGFTIGLSVNTYEQLDSIQNDYRSTFLYWSYDIGRMAMALGYIGLVMLICKLAWLPRIRHACSAVGRMALSNYIAHSIVCNIIFVGFGLYGQLRFHEIYYVVFAIWAVQLIVSPIWLNSFRYGPLEWLWRRLTYGQAVALRVAPKGSN